MKRYRFRLEQVLRVRQVQEDLAAAQLGLAQRDEAEAVATELARMQAITDRRRPTGAYDGATLLAGRAVWDAELDSLNRLAAARVAAGLRSDERRDEYLTASRRVTALELLDERRREEHRVETDRAEAKQVDDLVAGRHASRPHQEASR